MNQYSLRTPFCCLLHIVQFRLNMNDAQTHGLNAKSPREKKHCRITQGPLVWSLTCHQLGFALSIVVTVTPFYYRGPGTSGSPRTGGDLGWKMASAGIHPLALLSDGGATLFITHTHSHTHTHTPTHAHTHTHWDYVNAGGLKHKHFPLPTLYLLSMWKQCVFLLQV